ncbi:hypothetical protein ACRBEV_27945 [Methylobacterium phyllosphaerae]
MRFAALRDDPRAFAARTDLARERALALYGADRMQRDLDVLILHAAGRT